jgi:small subunit ribosomal protein S10
VCNLLEIEKSPVKEEPYQRWLLWVNKSKFAKKKYKYHYETRTYIRSMWVKYLTGSTASTFLEYIQRNIPEGIAM